MREERGEGLARLEVLTDGQVLQVWDAVRRRQAVKRYGAAGAEGDEASMIRVTIRAQALQFGHGKRHADDAVSLESVSPMRAETPG